jgi:ATP-dependent DNA ligase
MVDTFPYAGESRQELLRAARYWDAEGVVLKVGHREGWFKVKEVRTADLVCTGVKPGRADGKFIGEAGSVEGSAWREGHLVALGWFSGMCDGEREDIDGSCVGRVFEVEYQYVGAGGRMRHPRFVRWRDDKPAAECAVPEEVPLVT